MSGVRASQPVPIKSREGREVYHECNEGSLSTRVSSNKKMAMITYIKDAFSELKNHVTWTPQSELLRHTTVVVVFSIIFSLAIWGADSLLSRVVKFYFQLIS